MKLFFDILWSLLKRSKKTSDLDQLKADPTRRLHSSNMSEQEILDQATKYKTYQINGRDIDF